MPQPMNTPVMQWPFRMGIDGTIPFVEQDSIDEVAQCVAFALTAKPGELVGTPDLGLDHSEFRRRGITKAELVSYLHEWEPRGAVGGFTYDELTRSAQNVGIEVA